MSFILWVNKKKDKLRCKGYQNTNLKFIIPTTKSVILKMFKIPTVPIKIPTDPIKIQIYLVL